MTGYCAVRRRRLILASNGHRDQVRAVERTIDRIRAQARRRRREQQRALA